MSKTEEAGNLTPISFAKSVPTYDKIRFLVKEDVGPALGFIFQNITLLLGIKEPIADINKQDISKMIRAHYNNLSLEEIVYAFELERYGKLEPKTEHFQLVNAEYVAKVLNKYKDWLQKVRRENNISLSKPQEALPDISEKEKNNILIQGCIRCYNEFKESGLVKEGNAHIYDFMFDDLKIHQFTVDKKNAAISVSKRQLQEESKTLDRTTAKNILKQLQNDKSTVIINKSKRLLLTNYFNNLGKKDFVELINQYLIQ
mgnify:CR=1 FL=1|jgi:hypothetical protein|tara:strand:- start:12430 stop:13203 length:774 start_codon:yes stop_codon:yes gene_type:complete